jgi:hypothetical protein
MAGMRASNLLTGQPKAARQAYARTSREHLGMINNSHTAGV